MTKEEMCADGLMSVNQACKFLGVCRVTLYDAMNAGRIPWTTGVVDSRRRIPKKLLVEMLAASLIGGQLDQSPNVTMSGELTASS